MSSKDDNAITCGVTLNYPGGISCVADCSTILALSVFASCETTVRMNVGGLLEYLLGVEKRRVLNMMLFHFQTGVLYKVTNPIKILERFSAFPRMNIETVYQN